MNVKNGLNKKLNHSNNTLLFHNNRVLEKLCIILCCFFLVFLNSTGVKANDKTTEVTETPITDQTSEYITPKVTTNQLTPEVITNQTALSEIANVHKITFKDQSKNIGVPIKISNAGTLFLNYDNLYDYTIFPSIYSDAACTQEIQSNIGIYMVCEIPSAGIYYLKFDLFPSSDYETNLTFNYALTLIPSDIQLEAGTTTCGYQDDSTLNKDKYYKIVLTEPGFINFHLQWNYNPDYSDLTLCDSNKKTLRTCSESVFTPSDLNDTNYNFKMNKGTYYVKIGLPSEFYLISYNYSAYADNGGSSMKRAPKLKMDGIPVNGSCNATAKSGNADWYKIKLSKAQKFKITVISEKTLSIVTEIYDSKGNHIKTNLGTHIITNYKETDDTFTTATGIFPFKKGTYYIKLYKKSQNSPGEYSIFAE